MSRLFAIRAAMLFGIGFAGMLGAGATLAAMGTLPEALQDTVANAVDNIGVDIPGGEESVPAPATRPVVREETAGAGKAFKARPNSRYERSGESVYREDSGDHYPGYADEDPDDEEAEEEYDAQFPGELGEPGEPGFPESDNGADGESDGEPGEDGPPGEPG